MEYNSSLPIYLQVIHLLKQDICIGKIKPGEKLPSVRELALQYTINPNTASRVYSEMEREGICFTKRGMGTFITEDSERLAQMKEDTAMVFTRLFMDGIRQLGYDTEDAIKLISKYKFTE